MPTLLGVVGLLIGLIVVFAIAGRHRAIAAPLLIGFALRAILALIDSEVFKLPGQDDSYSFDFRAYYISQKGFLGTFEHLSTGVALYTWFISAMYAIFERSRLMMQSINVLFGSLIIFNAWRLTRVISDDARRSLIAAWMVALFPSLIFFSCVMLREVAVAYPLSLGVYYFDSWQRHKKQHHLVAGVAGLLVSMAFHSGGFAVLLGAGVWLFGQTLRALFRGQVVQFVRSSLALSVAIGAVAFAVSSGFGMEKFHAVESGELSELKAQQGNFARGRTVYLADLSAETPADLLWQAPLRLTYFLFAPFPWMLEEATDLVGLVDSCFFLFLCARVWRARRVLTEYPRAVVVLGVFAAMAFTFALGVSNYGTAQRHRNKMLPLLIAGSMSLPGRKRREIANSAAVALGLRAKSSAPAPAIGVVQARSHRL